MAGKKQNNTKPRSGSRPDPALHQSLVLHEWLLQQIGAGSVDALVKSGFDDPALELYDEENRSGFIQALIETVPPTKRLLSNDELLAHDYRIWKYTAQLNRNRREPLRWKYFQYFALLLSDIYLHRWFGDREGLCRSLNTFIGERNASAHTLYQSPLLNPAELNRLTFWSATGSGKTLLMHMHLLLFNDHAQRTGYRPTTRTLLITPNEGLSQQHLNELEQAGIAAGFFRKNAGALFAAQGQTVEIIEITKLSDSEGPTTVAVDSFESRNLLFVDEAHRGTSAREEGQWLNRRNRLCADGFVFEYSATFGQAVQWNPKGDNTLFHAYARSIAFDYSYKYFYRDGYGKDYSILNIDAARTEASEEANQLFLTACLLTYFQQLALHAQHSQELRKYRIEKPLWVFVGGSVSKPTANDLSDVSAILLFLARFAGDEKLALRRLRILLEGNPGLLNSRGQEIFSNSFRWLHRQNYTAESLYAAILDKLFNTKAGGLLHADVLRGSAGKGEIALRIGNAPYFGVINIGDTAGLLKQFDAPQYENSLKRHDKDFGESLFQQINHPDTSLNVLIGSKKFTEGWSSWRVSTMGLMNVGTGEGAQIIQLFGRGVRLQGLDFCLKRSSALRIFDAKNPQPDWLPLLETLNIFGIRANYMEEFRKYIEAEELPPNDGVQERELIVLPVIQNLGKHQVKVLRVKHGFDYRKQVRYLRLDVPKPGKMGHPVQLDLRTKLQSISSGQQPAPGVTTEPRTFTFQPQHLCFFNWDEIYFKLQDYKNERGWNNLNFDRETLRKILETTGWYGLDLAEQELAFSRFGQVTRWQEIGVMLLKRYCERYYKRDKAGKEAEHLEYVWLDEHEADPAAQSLLPAAYHVSVDKNQGVLIEQLQRLSEELPRLNADWKHQGMEALVFGRHGYKPLLYFGQTEEVKVSPVALNEGERDFVHDLRQYYNDHRDTFFADRELVLLRNQGKGRGIGFFEAGNFYPDFVLWILHGSKQYMTFIDPHGLRNTKGFGDEKIQLYKTIKNIETRLKVQDSQMILNACIISVTPFSEVSWWNDKTDIETFHEHHVWFMRDERERYIGQILHNILS